MNLGLEKKIVLITASSAGIGKATAMAFLQEGAIVILNGRNRERLKEVQCKLGEEFGKERVWAFCGDACEDNIIKEFKEYVKSKWGRLDILVPNIGTGKPTGEGKLSISEWQFMMEKNLFGTVSLIHEFEELLCAGKNASIILVSSIAAYERGNAPYAYAAAKRGLLALNKYLAGDFARKNIRINCVVPGNIYFPGGRWEELYQKDSEGVSRFIKENVPLNRFGSPEEIASSIVFLASEKSMFTSGAELVVDGGQKRS